MHTLSRRSLLLGAAPLLAAAQPATETHVHLFDPQRVPYAPDAPYKPAAYTLEQHLKLVEAAPLAHSIIVHPEPYQDDHRYLEYCLAHEPRSGYFKGTCLFDPFRYDGMRALVERWPKRIVALRIHAVSKTPEASGPIRNRDLSDPRMLACWKEASRLGLAIQMHFIPAQARHIHALAEQLPGTVVLLDHMGRPGQGSAEEYQDVLNLSKFPRVMMKFSNWTEYKGDLAQLARRIYDAFGPDRMLWGVLGNTVEDYRKNSARFNELLGFASEGDRAKIRAGNARRLFFA